MDMGDLIEHDGKTNIKSCSQNGQDAWVLNETNFKTEGYFVDFGATDGYEFNNTYVLEKNFQWSGICCEPNKLHHKKLVFNRPNSIIDFRCVYSKTNEKVNFLNVNNDPDKGLYSGLSTIDEYGSTGLYPHVFAEEENYSSYEIKTVSLNDLLEQHNAPNDIDFLSIDTEGSEYDILSNFDWDKYNIKLIAVEHNWTSDRIKLFDLLVMNGYDRVRIDESKWDDWYVKR